MIDAPTPFRLRDFQRATLRALIQTILPHLFENGADDCGMTDRVELTLSTVFGDVEVSSADEVAVRWEQLKKAEKGRESVMEGIPAALPALLYASKVQKKAESQDVAWRDLTGPAPDHPTGPSAAALDPASIGYRLLELVDEARARGEDPETELRIAAEHLRDRFRDRER